MEALWLYAERGSPTAIWQILRARNESKSLLSQGVPNPQERLEALKTLFYGRQDITLNVYPKPIEIGPYTSDDDALSIGVGWYKDKLNGGQLIGPTSSKIQEALYSTVPVILIQNPAESPMVYRLDHDHNKQFLPPIKPLHHIFLGADGLSAAQISDFWDQIVLTDLEDKIIEALRLIAPELQRVSLTSAYNDSNERIMMARMTSFSRPIPLRSLGEGINRLFGIALALVNAKEGMLLIDEIESGLYHAALPDVWRLIFELARTLNVQVFATSHSWDCLEAFAKATKDNEQKSGQLISLREHQKEEGSVAAVLFDEEEVDFVANERIEVR